MWELVLHATRANFLPAVSETTVFCRSRFAFRGYPGKKYVVNGCWLVRWSLKKALLAHSLSGFGCEEESSRRRVRSNNEPNFHLISRIIKLLRIPKSCHPAAAPRRSSLCSNHQI